MPRSRGLRLRDEAGRARSSPVAAPGMAVRPRSVGLKRMQEEALSNEVDVEELEIELLLEAVYRKYGLRLPRSTHTLARTSSTAAPRARAGQ